MKESPPIIARIKLSGSLSYSNLIVHWFEFSINLFYNNIYWFLIHALRKTAHLQPRRRVKRRARWSLNSFKYNIWRSTASEMPSSETPRTFFRFHKYFRSAVQIWFVLYTAEWHDLDRTSVFETCGSARTFWTANNIKWLYVASNKNFKYRGYRSIKMNPTLFQLLASVGRDRTRKRIHWWLKSS